MAPCVGMETLVRLSQLAVSLVRVTLPTLPSKESMNAGNSIVLYMLIITFIPLGDPPIF